MLMIFPPLRLSIDLAASFERRKTALSCVSMTLSQSSGFSFNTPPLRDTLPALFTRMPDATELALDLVQRGLQSGAIGHINLHRNRWNTDRFQFGKHSLVLFVVSSKHCDGSPGFGQSERNAAPNSAITTSHDSHPTG
jgi:hypothetical protein